MIWPAELRTESEALEAGGCSPPRSSVGLPDGVEDLDHLLVDDENYGNIQADAAETWDCSFIEATDWHKDTNGQGKKML